MQNKVYLAAAVGVVFLILALGGSFITTRQMNRTADEHAMSAGRPGDAAPNLIQEQQNDKSARGSSATGQTTGSNVPGSSRQENSNGRQ